jgi:HlyD family secretion protein
MANVGEVLPAGGKVFTMLDISYAYMDIYLPTREAVRFGSDSRIVLDAYPNLAIPANVSLSPRRRSSPLNRSRPKTSATN